MTEAEAVRELPGPHAATPGGKPRARALGIPFDGTPGIPRFIGGCRRSRVGCRCAQSARGTAARCTPG